MASPNKQGAAAFPNHQPPHSPLRARVNNRANGYDPNKHSNGHAGPDSEGGSGLGLKLGVIGINTSFTAVGLPPKRNMKQQKVIQKARNSLQSGRMGGMGVGLVFNSSRGGAGALVEAGVVVSQTPVARTMSSSSGEEVPHSSQRKRQRTNSLGRFGVPTKGRGD